MINDLVNAGLKVSNKIAKVLVKAKTKPMTVTVFRFIVAAPLSWYFFSRGHYLYNIIGLLTYMALAILDWVDGDMAQLYKLPKATAPFGRLIDHNSDRVLMLVVLGSIFYAGMIGKYHEVWIILTVLYYSLFFLLTVLIYEFDKMFGLKFEDYPKIEEQMYQTNSSPDLIDKISYNLLYVHNNSLTNFCFTHNYVLVLGILTNQLLPAFIFITVMHFIRSAGIFLITFRALKPGDTDSVLTKVLRKHLPAN